MTTRADDRVLRHAAGWGCLWLGLLGPCAARAPAKEAPPYDAAYSAAVPTPESAIRNWPERPRAVAGALIAEYGEPSRFSDNELVWLQNGPWHMTVVHRDAPESFLRPKNILEQSIRYDVPAGKISALNKFDAALRFDNGSGELVSQGESESLNLLAVNLAQEIVAGKRTPAEARDFYRKTVRLSESGKSSPYMTGFLFPLPDAKPSTTRPETNPKGGAKPAVPPYDGEIQSLDP
jgi:hypothetical protein